MPLYLVQFAYSSETWARLLKNPEDRTTATESMVRQSGGRLVGLYYHAGEYDGFVLADLPDDAAANALAMATASSGAMRLLKTTRLYSPSEVVETLGKAARLQYRPPGKK